MTIPELFKSVLDQDDMPVVICDLQHIVVYMNPAAVEHYVRYGGNSILGRSIFDCHNERSREMIEKVVGWFAADRGNNKVHTFYNSKLDKDVYMIALRNDRGELIGYYEKHESRVRDDSPFYFI